MTLLCFIYAVTGDRGEFFERWTVPPLGPMVLGQAESLDHLPEEIAKLRETFLRVRRGLIGLEEAKQATLLLGRYFESFSLQATMLKFAAGKVETYSSRRER